MLLLALWIGVIWGFSAQSGTNSEVSSNGISTRIAELLFRTPSKAQHFAVECWVRKLAHMTEFAFFAMVALTTVEAMKARRPGLRAMLLTALLASTDELHQLFVPGRNAMLADVLIDCLGGALGVEVLLLIRRIFWKRSRMKPVDMH